MARSNYQFDKRQKELARKKKQELKRQNKIDKKNTQSESSEAQTQIEEKIISIQFRNESEMKGKRYAPKICNFS